MLTFAHIPCVCVCVLYCCNVLSEEKVSASYSEISHLSIFLSLLCLSPWQCIKVYSLGLYAAAAAAAAAQLLLYAFHPLICFLGRHLTKFEQS